MSISRCSTVTERYIFQSFIHWFLHVLLYRFWLMKPEFNNFLSIISLSLFKFASVRLWTVQFLCLGERSVWCFCFVLLIPGMLGFCGNVILKVAALQRLSAAPADGGPLLMHDSFTAHYRPTLHPAQASPLGYLMEAIAWGVGGGGESLHIRPVIGWLGSI